MVGDHINALAVPDFLFDFNIISLWTYLPPFDRYKLHPVSAKPEIA